MALSASLPEWLPWWLPMVIFIPFAVYLVIFLFMPFSVFGVKGRLEEINSVIIGLTEELRNIRADIYALIEEKREGKVSSIAPIEGSKPFVGVSENLKKEQKKSSSSITHSFTETENKPVREAFEAYKTRVRSGNSKEGFCYPFQNQTMDRFTFSGTESFTEVFKTSSGEKNISSFQKKDEQKTPAFSSFEKEKGQQAEISKERNEPKLGFLYTESEKK